MQRFLRIDQAQILLTLIVLVGGVMRLYNLNWDEGHYLHPDERLYINASNIKLPSSIQEFLSPDSPLNPNMFYYGSFPLFVYKGVYTLFASNSSFLIVSRAVSAFFSILTIPVIYYIGKVLFSRKTGLLAAFIFAFSVGSIQHAHFNSTESVLVLLISLITHCSIQLVRHRKYFLVVLLAIFTGVSYGTKIIGLTFILIPILSLLYFMFKERKPVRNIAFLSSLILLSVSVGFFVAPYQLLDYAQFSQEQTYMQNVILGKDKPVFTIIYENTTPYFYQFIHVFPFVIGFLTFPLSLIGVFFVIKNILRRRKDYYLQLFIVFYPLVYFFWFGMWYAKFSRYSMLLLPFIVLWAAVALARVRRPFVFMILFLVAINGFLYLRVYAQTHTRIAASGWIYDNIQAGKTIVGEHWDDNLPLHLRSTKVLPQYNLRQLEVYNPDTTEKVEKLASELSQADYFVISSRRVYYSILRNSDKYPYTTRFYQLLFDEKLGYRLIESFTNYPFFFSDDIADESFQSYDHPPVYIFENKESLQSSQIKELIFNET